MSFLENPNFYISVFSTVCLVCSEILPFLPIKSNGILHAIIECLASFSKNNITPNTLSNEEKVIEPNTKNLEQELSTK